MHLELLGPPPRDTGPRHRLLRRHVRSFGAFASVPHDRLGRRQALAGRGRPAGRVRDGEPRLPPAQDLAVVPHLRPGWWMPGATRCRTPRFVWRSVVRRADRS